MNKNRKIFITSVSGLVFLCCFYYGLLLAQYKPLWNDEIFTQTSNVNHATYVQQWLGQIGEGNNAPLFYSIQKLFCQIIQYQTPDLWNVQNIYDRLILRINPIFFMSATIACIFFYFSRFYSLYVGAYSLFISISSFVIWNYWVEARPYAMWIFFTAIHTMHFLYLMNQEKISRKAWRGLTIIQFLLCLTIIFSVAQITIVSGLLWLFKERRWKKYILTSLIPIGITLYYYVLSPKLNFWFDLTPEQLIRDCFSRDRFYILFIFTFFLAVFYLAKKIGRPKSFPNKILLEGSVCFAVTVLMLLASFCVIALLKINASPRMQGFAISSRYFVYLTPISIISTTLLSITIFRSLAGNRWIQMLVLSGMGYLIVHRFFKLLPHMKMVSAPIFS